MAVMLLGGVNFAWATDYSTTYDFNSWVTTNLTTLGQQTSLTVTGDNIATADAANVKVISDISTPAFAFGGRFATDDISNVYMRNGSSSKNQHKVNLGIQSKAANKHFSILNLKKGDVVTIVTGSGETSFVSTNATVGGVQVVSGNRVGTDVDGTETGATTVCTMTADGNLDLKLGTWAVIMSVKIEYTDTYSVSSTSTMTDGYTVNSVRGISMTYHGTWTYENKSNRGGMLASGTYPTGRTNNLPNDGSYLIFIPSVTGKIEINVNIYGGHGTFYLVDKDNGHVFSSKSDKKNNDYTNLKDFGTIVAGHTYYLYGLNCDWGYEFHSFKFTPKDNDITSYAVASGDIVEYGSEIDYVNGVVMTYGGADDVVWNYVSDRGPGVNAGANATLTSGIPTAGTFVKFEPTSNGLLTLNWYAYASGGTITATLIDADQTIKEVKTHSNSNSESNASYTDDYTTLLRPGVTYYLYLRGADYNNNFKGFVFSKKTEVEAAIYDCKAWETSSAFATAIDAETFANTDAVYAFHTNWQVENGTASKAIFNNTVTSADNWWGNLQDEGANYDGAPDTKYLSWGDAYNVHQTVKGLPAGSYHVSAWTYASAAGYRKLYISKVPDVGGWEDLITPESSAAGWIKLEGDFTLTETANIAFGFYGAAITSGTTGFDNWTLTKLESVGTKSGRNYASYVTPQKLDFSAADGITAYIATGLNGGGNAVVLKSVDIVPAGEPIIVKTDTKGATVNVPVTTADASDVSGNNLVAGDGTTAWNGTAGYTYYYLASDQFHEATGGTLQSGKAYLKVANGGAARQLSIVFGDDETTGIADVRGKKEDVNGNFFDLSGRKVAQPTKGLYIVNGKKVIIK